MTSIKVVGKDVRKDNKSEKGNTNVFVIFKTDIFEFFCVYSFFSLFKIFRFMENNKSIPMVL